MSLDHTKQLIETHRITMKVGDYPKRHSDGGMSYHVILFYQGRQLTLKEFYFGPAFQEPAIEYVLEALLTEAAGIENNPSAGEWLHEYDMFDEDDYNTCVRQTEKLKRFLGEEYTTFLWEA